MPIRQLKVGKQGTSTPTPHNDDALQVYLNEIGKINLISPTEEVELAQRIKQGDRQALEKLTKANLRFVVSVAKQYQNQGLSLHDLINEGNIGLVKAAQRFDETKGFKFISYAVRWIRQSILHALAEHGRFVRLPLNKILGLNKINKTNEDFRMHNQRDATPVELANLLGIDIDEISDIQQLPSFIVSFESPVLGGTNDNTFLDLLGNNNSSPDNRLICESEQQNILNHITCLCETEREILTLFYGLNGTQEKTLEEIAEIFGQKREKIRQLKDGAIRKLKHRAKKQYIRMPIK